MMFAAPAEPYLLPDPVRLPAVPARELAPVLSADPDALALRSAAHELHWIAFATLHGPPPKGLEVFQVAVTTEQGDLDPAMIVSRPEAPSDVAAAWVEAFEAGLDTWSEAGFDSHVTHPAGEGAGVAVAPHDQAIHDACRRLLRAGRHEMLRNMKRTLGAEFDPKFDPDHETFAGRRNTPRSGR